MQSFFFLILELMLLWLRDELTEGLEGFPNPFGREEKERDAYEDSHVTDGFLKGATEDVRCSGEKYSAICGGERCFSFPSFAFFKRPSP